jgi:hypothetical protein
MLVLVVFVLRLTCFFVMSVDVLWPLVRNDISSLGSAIYLDSWVLSPAPSNPSILTFSLYSFLLHLSIWQPPTPPN